MRIKTSSIEYVTHMLNWSKACYDAKNDYMNCLPCYMQRFRDPKTKPDPAEGRQFWIQDELRELSRQLRNFTPTGDIMMCTSHDPFSKHSYTTAYAVLRQMMMYPQVTEYLRVLSKYLDRIMPVAASEQIPINAIYGATITTLSKTQAMKYQPGMDLPKNQILTLNNLHALGYRTWVSIEPVYSKMDIPKLVNMIPDVETIVVGKLNKVSSDPHEYDVLSKEEFRQQVNELIEQFPGKQIYIKKELDRWLRAKEKSKK